MIIVSIFKSYLFQVNFKNDRFILVASRDKMINQLSIVTSMSKDLS